MNTNAMRAQPRLFALAAAGWGYAGALIALFPPSGQGFMAYLYTMPWHSVGLAWAGWHWLRQHHHDKGYAHLLAGLLLALPRLYTLPTDSLGPLPMVGLALSVGLYLHVSVMRGGNISRVPERQRVLPLVGLALALPLLHVLVAQAHVALKSEWLALR